MGREDLTGRLPEIGLPAFVVIGEVDHDPGPAAEVSMAARFPQARLVALSGAGHVCALESPSAFTAEQLKFLAAVPAD